MLFSLAQTQFANKFGKNPNIDVNPRREIKENKDNRKIKALAIIKETSAKPDSYNQLLTAHFKDHSLKEQKPEMKNKEDMKQTKVT